MTDTNDVDNEDKKVIADEEREKMLNAENIIREETKDKLDDIDKEKDLKELEKEKEAAGENEKKDEEEGMLKPGEFEKRKKKLEESQKEGRSKIWLVPIGAMKLPDFLRYSRGSKNQESDGTPEEGADLLETSAQKPGEPSGLRATLAKKLETVSVRNPFSKKEPVEGEEPKPRLLDRIKIPGVAVLPKRFTRGNKDQKQDLENGAELATSETLEDRKPSMDDGMESVKLDGDEKGDEKDVEKAGLAGEGERKPLHLVWLDRLKNLSQHEKAVAVLVLFLILLIIIIVAALGPSGPPPTAPPVVDGKVVTTTQCGPVEGLARDGIHVFKGIPFAVPPVNEGRWRHAKPLDNIRYCWEGTYLAHNASKMCWQYTEPTKIDGYEDCLTLDIYSPEVRYINPMPVVVLIETASLIGGPTGVLQPTPKIVRSKEVVFVKPNFRLGVLGFLAALPLRETTHPPTSGNYGLSDILMALRWIQINIQHFGGDPDRVTVLGHRAGATVVTALVTSPLATGLASINRAWASSGSSLFPGDPVSKQEADNQRYVDKLCSDSEASKISCLLEKEAETLLESTDEDWKRPAAVDLPATTSEATANTRDWLVVDGVIIREHVWKAEVKAQLVLGTTAQSEATTALWDKVNKFSGDRGQAIRTHVMDSLVGRTGLGAEALQRYNSTWEGLVTMISDIKTVCPLLVMARAMTNIPFYVATMPRDHSGLGIIADVDLDMSALMGTYEPQAPAQRDFVKSMQDVFYRFVDSGELPKPSPPLLPQPILNISRSLEWIHEYPNCDFWISKDIVPKYARKD